MARRARLFSVIGKNSAACLALVVLRTLDRTASAGILDGSVSTATLGTMNLTTEGTDDWAVWGGIDNQTQGSLTPYDQKNVSSHDIEGLTLLGGLTVADTTNRTDQEGDYTWSDGTNTMNEVTPLPLFMQAYPQLAVNPSTVGPPVGTGFQFTFAADNLFIRTLTLVVVDYDAGSVLTASLSDGSAAAYTSDLSTSNIETVLPGTYTITYLANSPGQTLTIDYTKTAQSGIYDNIAIESASLSAIPVSESVWTNSGGGSWSNSANWSDGIPQHPGDIAGFLGSITAPSTVTLDGNWTAGGLAFNNTNSYTLAAGNSGTLTLDNGAESATIADLGGTHYITAPLTLNSNTIVTVVNAGDGIHVSGNVSGAGSLTVSGGGTVVLSGINTYSGGTAVNSGLLLIDQASALPNAAGLTIGNDSTTATVQLASGSGRSTVSSLTINTGSTLDVTNNTFVVQYGGGTDPAATIRSELISGFNPGAPGRWAGTGITSSLAAANPTSFSVGYADGDNPADAANTGVPAGEVEIKYTVAGDANLSGGVDLSDLVIIASDFGQTGADWAEGDVNYDGNVDLSDLVIVASNFGASLTSVQPADFSSSFAAQWQLALAEIHGADVSVPEPATLAVSLTGSAGLLCRRRRATFLCG
jgi:autotransporter-associated beta strand protein